MPCPSEAYLWTISSRAALMSSAGEPSRTASARSRVSGSWEMKIRVSRMGVSGLLMGTCLAGVLAEPHADGLEQLVLDGHGLPGLDQLEDAEEEDQGLFERALLFEIGQKVEHVPLAEDGDELLHLLLDRDVARADDAGVRDLAPLHHQEEGLGQVKERD